MGTKVASAPAAADWRLRAARGLSKLFPYALGAALLSVALTPSEMSPGTTTIAGLTVGGLLSVLGAIVSRKRITALTAVSLGAIWSSVLWFAIATTWAISPTISLFGAANVNNGVALWLLAATWYTAAITIADARALKETLAVLSAFGAILASSVIWEAATSGLRTTSNIPAGLLVNSISTAEVLALTAVTSAAGHLMKRTNWMRYVFTAGLILSLVGLFIEGAQTSLLAIVALGAVASTLYYRKNASIRSSLFVGILSTGAPSLITIVAAAISAGIAGQPLLNFMQEVTNQRGTIWASASSRIGRAPILGSGLDQFTAVIDWRAAPFNLETLGTFDTHNIYLGVLLGGGVVGLLLALVALATIVAAAAEVSSNAKRGWAVALIASAPVLLLGAGIASWWSPTATMGAFALSGAFIGAGSAREIFKDTNNKPKRLVTAKIVKVLGLSGGIAALVVAALYAPAYDVTYEYARSQMPGERALSDTELNRLYERYPDPKIGQHIIGAMLQPGTKATAGDLTAALALTQGDSRWATNLAQAHLNAWSILAEAGVPNAKDGFDAALTSALESDRSTGAWHAYAAIEYDRQELHVDAVRSAKQALKFRLTPAQLKLVDGIANRKR